jgi:hypothetical protein
MALSNLLRWVGNFSADHVRPKGTPYFDVTHPDFGAVGDGVADDYVAIQAALDACVAAGGGRVYLPAGIYKITQGLVMRLLGLYAQTHGSPSTSTVPMSVILEGAGSVSVIKPTSAVAVTLTLGGEVNDDGVPHPITVRHLRFDGSNTSGKTGVLVGDNPGALSGTIHLEYVYVAFYAGTGGVGVHIQDVVSPMLIGCSLTRSATNLLLEATVGGAGLPTEITLTGGTRIGLADKKGIVINTGFMIKLTPGCVVEGSGEEGIYVVPAAGRSVVALNLEGVWLEGNCRTGGTYPVYIDGSAGDAIVRITDCLFNSANAIYLNNVPDFVLDNILTGAVSINGGNSQGEITNWPENNYSFETLVTVASACQPRVKIPQQIVDRFDQIEVTSGHYVMAILKGWTKQLDINSTSAFTIDDPTLDHATQNILKVKVKNNAGATLGTATWSSNWVLGETWVNPTSGKQRIITFLRDANTGKYQQIAPSIEVSN